MELLKTKNEDFSTKKTVLKLTIADWDSVCSGLVSEIKLVRFAHNWPPVRWAYAPEGMMEYWNIGFFGNEMKKI
jgi:hypothetical protein